VLLMLKVITLNGIHQSKKTQNVTHFILFNVLILLNLKIDS